MNPYPAARRSDENPDDPYRWMEDADSAETKAFIEAQNEASQPVLAELSSLEAFSESVAKLLSANVLRGVTEAGDWVYAWRSDSRDQPELVRAKTFARLADSESVLDPNRLSDDGTVAVNAISFNQDGTLMAYTVADAGSDWFTIRVLDLETLETLDDAIEWCKWNRPQWMPDGSSFTYWAYDAPDGNALTDTMGHGRLKVHQVGADTDPTTEDDSVTVLWESEDPRMFARHHPPSDDWFVLSTDTGSSSGNDLQVRAHDDYLALQLVDGHEHEWTPVGILDDRLFVITDSGAARYRLDSFDLISGERSVIVPEHATDVLLDATLIRGAIAVVFSHDASHRLDLFSLDGEQNAPVPLPEGIAITGITGDSESSSLFVDAQTFVDPGTAYMVETDGPRAVRVDAHTAQGASAVQTERIRATSKDGTVVPAFVVRRSADDAPAPTLLWGYGGFNIPLNPGFRALFAAWVDAGGTLVIPNLRGGGEFGSEWHKAGTKQHKQNVFDDLYAVAEHIREVGISDRIALHGRSNGGLLSGAALTQRPELWNAVMPAVGVLDMLRFHLFTIGWAWISDYGDPDDEAAAEYLRAYSPLHNTVEREYPPTLITTGDHDDRVVPAHSLKFAATLQRAQRGDAPILLAVDTRAGHGMGKPKSAQVDEYAQQLAFAAEHTGLSLR